MEKYRALFSVCWLLTGLIYLLFSGQAEGFVSVRTILIFVVIILFVVTLINARKFLASLIRKNYTVSKNEGLHLLPKIIGLVLVFAGHQLDERRITESMQRGDALVQAIEDYKTKHGAYPASIEEGGFQKYKPALKYSEFFYSKKDETKFSVSFDSVAFLICTRNNISPGWECDD